MYRYHVVGRGFSDVGYNFAIDHRGTVYEGRWARHYAPGERHDGEDGAGFGVVGAHAARRQRRQLRHRPHRRLHEGQADLGRARPASIQLISWKASLHQVDPLGTDEYISIFGLHRTFPNIAGHRQTGQTACPGPLLFNQLPLDPRAGGGPRRPLPGRRPIDMSKALRWTEPRRAGRPASSPAPSGRRGPQLAANPDRGEAHRLPRSSPPDGRVITLGKAAQLGSPADVGPRRRSRPSPACPGATPTSPPGRPGGWSASAARPAARRRPPWPRPTWPRRPSGQGYWVLTSSGGVYAFGSAKHYGSLSRSGVGSGGRQDPLDPERQGVLDPRRQRPHLPLRRRRQARSAPASGGAVDFWPTPSRRRATGSSWPTAGSGPTATPRTSATSPASRSRWSKPAVAIVGMPSGRGYAIAVRDGGVFNFGSSPFLGSLGGSGRQVVGMALAFG